MPDKKGLSQVRFVRVRKGYLSLYHRPGRWDMAKLPQLRCTHVVTLLRKDEGAFKIGNAVRKAGMTWLWRPIPNADLPKGEVHESMIATIKELGILLEHGARILIHCSAGIHRTGMMGYGLMRYLGYPKWQAFWKIRRMRKQTRDGMLPRHIAWGDSLAQANHSRL